MKPYRRRLAAAAVALALTIPAFTAGAADTFDRHWRDDPDWSERHYDRDYDRRYGDRDHRGHEDRRYDGRYDGRGYYYDEQHRGHGRFLYFNARADRQHERIVDGIRSGALTRDEAERLRDQQRRLARAVDRFTADGRLTAEERGILDDRFNRASDLIRELRHNGLTRHGRYEDRPPHHGHYGDRPPHHGKPPYGHRDDHYDRPPYGRGPKKEPWSF